MKRKAGRTIKSSRRKRTGQSASRRAARITSSEQSDTLVAASAQALGISLDPAWHEAIASNLRLLLLHAKLVDEFALPDDIEPASVFYA
jgi:Protein of unknown function (DUF4089)